VASAKSNRSIPLLYAQITGYQGEGEEATMPDSDFPYGTTTYQQEAGPFWPYDDPCPLTVNWPRHLPGLLLGCTCPDPDDIDVASQCQRPGWTRYVPESTHCAVSAGGEVNRNGLDAPAAVGPPL
jgi:hypothetical protein